MAADGAAAGGAAALDAARPLLLHPLSRLTSAETGCLAAMPEAELLAFAGLASRYSSFAPRITAERLRAIHATLALHQRHDMRVDEHFLASLATYEAAGWAVKEVAFDASKSGRRSVRALRVMLQSPDQRAFVDKFPHVCDVSAIDATFTVGKVPIHTYAWLGHLPESGGDAIPLAFMLTLAAPDDDVPDAHGQHPLVPRAVPAPRPVTPGAHAGRQVRRHVQGDGAGGARADRERGRAERACCSGCSA